MNQLDSCVTVSTVDAVISSISREIELDPEQVRKIIGLNPTMDLTAIRDKLRLEFSVLESENLEKIFWMEKDHEIRSEAVSRLCSIKLRDFPTEAWSLYLSELIDRACLLKDLERTAEIVICGVPQNHPFYKIAVERWNKLSEFLLDQAKSRLEVLRIVNLCPVANHFLRVGPKYSVEEYYTPSYIRAVRKLYSLTV